MTRKTVAGPFSKEAAYETAEALGNQYTVYSAERKDQEGYGTDEHDYYIEHDDKIIPDRIFGYCAKEFMARQFEIDGKQNDNSI